MCLFGYITFLLHATFGKGQQKTGKKIDFEIVAQIQIQVNVILINYFIHIKEDILSRDFKCIFLKLIV